MYSSLWRTLSAHITRFVLGRLLGVPWDRFLVTFGSLWEAFWPPSGPLGVHLGSIGALSVAFGTPEGAFWVPVSCFGVPLGATGFVLTSFWEPGEYLFVFCCKMLGGCLSVLFLRLG